MFVEVTWPRINGIIGHYVLDAEPSDYDHHQISQRPAAYLAGTRRFSSVNQFRTTWSLGLCSLVSGSISEEPSAVA